jgi:H3 lysine-79-specific histone-lysine N-methyltransferase
MGPFDGALKGKNYKTLAVKKEKVITTVRPVQSSITKIANVYNTSSSSASSSSFLTNGNAKHTNGHVRSQSRSLTPSRPGERDPKNVAKNERASNLKRSSPAVSTPRFDESDSSDDEEQEIWKRKRPKLERTISSDSKRRIINLKSFPPRDQEAFPMVHALDIANYGTPGVFDSKYSNIFSALDEDEEDEPVIELQYPGSSQRERFHLVKSRDVEDFSPLDEIINVVKNVARHYLDEDEASVIDDEINIGLVQKMEQARARGRKGKLGAQTAFINAVDEYNQKITELRNDGSLEKRLDSLHAIDYSLVETVINQIYTRTVSPRAHLLREYENGTSLVYGEILPRFMNTIFKETRLKSDHVFLDLGSGVGNCVLQASLEIGCESWGCEIMRNPCDFADKQKEEFHARCRLWGIEPGAVHLERASFLTHPPITEVIKRADVILINNRAFQADLMEDLKWKLLDVKKGCKIVSLKPFREPDHKIQERHIDDPVNVLQVRKKEYPTRSVSWTGDAGDWYLTWKDPSELEAFRLQRGLN